MHYLMRYKTSAESTRSRTNSSLNGSPITTLTSLHDLGVLLNSDVYKNAILPCQRVVI